MPLAFTKVHGISCKPWAVRSIRQHQLNDLIWRALSRASTPTVKLQFPVVMESATTVLP